MILKDLEHSDITKTIRCNDCCRNFNEQNGCATKKVYDQMPEPNMLYQWEAVQTEEDIITILTQLLEDAIELCQ